MDCQNDECQARSASQRRQSAAQAMRKTMADIYDLDDPRATTATQNMQEIRIKVSCRSADSGSAGADAMIAALAEHIEQSGNVESIIAENLRLQGEVEALTERLSAGSWIKLANEIEALREQNEALQIALKSAQWALDAISGTLAIYRAHQT